MAGQRILVPSMGVRLPPSQPLFLINRAWPVRLAVQDAALSRRRSPVRIWYGLPRVFRDTPSPSYMARSSSGSGRRPLKAEITSSNLVRATKFLRASSEALFMFNPPLHMNEQTSPCMMTQLIMQGLSRGFRCIARAHTPAWQHASPTPVSGKQTPCQTARTPAIRAWRAKSPPGKPHPS